MSLRPVPLVCVLASASLVSLPALAQQATATLAPVTVTATPFGADENLQILAPTQVLRGDALRNRTDSALGDVLANEPGVSASSFGAGASRPVIRGLGGPRVKVLQNGIGIADVSTLSEDHAVGLEAGSARQIEILRGPATLLYGSGAIGGLVNVVNDRIPTELVSEPGGEIEARHSTAARSNALSFALDASAGQIGLHADGNWLDAGDYEIPGFAAIDDPSSASGRLPLSYTRQKSGGFGLSHVARWGHLGASVSSHKNRYGVPSEEGARIDLSQMRYDLEGRVNAPLPGIEAMNVKLGYTDYEHTEADIDYVPEVEFTNRALETRWELRHAPLAGWRGVFGVQTEAARYAALGADPGDLATVPATRSRSLAGFLVEERDFGPIRVNAGARFETVDREPSSGQDRRFKLASYSLGGLWQFTPGYGLGSTFSYAQRAPSAEELYSNGAHHATETFDVGNAGLRKETSRNVEVSLQKTEGLLRWKANLFENRFDDFVYGRLTGNELDEDGVPGGDLNERLFTQADAVLRGAEVEVSYNRRGQGFSTRAFADTSRGKLADGSNLPLQPPTRVGLDFGYRQGAWNAGLNTVHALRAKRLASFETNPTPAYTRMDASLSYTQRAGKAELTWFAIVRNLLDDEIRLSTSLLKDLAPQPGRSLVVGVRGRF